MPTPRLWLRRFGVRRADFGMFSTRPSAPELDRVSCSMVLSIMGRLALRVKEDMSASIIADPFARAANVGASRSWRQVPLLAFEPERKWLRNHHEGRCWFR